MTRFMLLLAFGQQANDVNEKRLDYFLFFLCIPFFSLSNKIYLVFLPSSYRCWLVGLLVSFFLGILFLRCLRFHFLERIYAICKFLSSIDPTHTRPTFSFALFPFFIFVIVFFLLFHFLQIQFPFIFVSFFSFSLFFHSCLFCVPLHNFHPNTIITLPLDLSLVTFSLDGFCKNKIK